MRSDTMSLPLDLGQVMVCVCCVIMITFWFRAWLGRLLSKKCFSIINLLYFQGLCVFEMLGERFPKGTFSLPGVTPPL